MSDPQVISSTVAPTRRPATARASGNAAARAPATTPRPEPMHIDGEDRFRMIAEAAFYRAEQRGFQPGQELDDWLAAEIEVDALLQLDDGPLRA